MKITLTNDVAKRMEAYVASVTTEISGWGKAEFDEIKQEWLITDIAIFEQEVSGSETEIDGEVLGKFVTDLVKKGEDPKDWCLWWHSHANMNVFWSGTDTSTMAKQSHQDVLLSIVTNRKKEYLARIDWFDKRPAVDTIHGKMRPFSNSHVDEVELFIEETTEDKATLEKIEKLQAKIDAAKEAGTKKLKEVIEKEVKEKVKTKTYDNHKGTMRSIYPYDNTYLYGSQKRMGFDDEPKYSKTKVDDAYDEWQSRMSLMDDVPGLYEEDDAEDNMFVPEIIRTRVKSEYFIEVKDDPNLLGETEIAEAEDLAQTTDWDELESDIDLCKEEIASNDWTTMDQLNEAYINLKKSKIALLLKAKKIVDNKLIVSKADKEKAMNFLKTADDKLF